MTQGTRRPNQMKFKARPNIAGSRLMSKLRSVLAREHQYLLSFKISRS